ncbi:MAG: carbohydrate-binding protein [Clostridia bacterium]|nr:carbohydrate-binding protein [Clostridia bacterium]
MKSTMNNNSYITNGLTINPTSFSSGDKIKITYTGLLLQSGAKEIYAHVGWGDSWEDCNDIKMSKTKTGFTATITVKKSSVLNMCFKDALDNWDNNNGYNYAIYPSKKK